MIRPDAVPIGHIPPLPRIDLNARPPCEPSAQPALGSQAGIPTAVILEQHRIWNLVIEASGGSL
jgi:hypothetical protein